MTLVRCIPAESSGKFSHMSLVNPELPRSHAHVTRISFPDVHRTKRMYHLCLWKRSIWKRQMTQWYFHQSCRV